MMNLIASNTPEPVELRELSNVFGNALSVFLGIGGILLFVMFIVGGFQFMSAGGDQKAISAAWKTLTFAFVGLVLVAGAYLILKLITGFTGANDLLNFNVYLPNH